MACRVMMMGGVMMVGVPGMVMMARRGIGAAGDEGCGREGSHGTEDAGDTHGLFS
jgi:hypothetical protein